ncbi:transporter substrate-binding domain-containing protein [Streptomyces sp. NPDC005529]|uniref:transporter substrate-binding domain-containing protein n=1 Tax=unclassified Streptomyces TaxID=2593676 RepID=UPI0033A1FB2A
MRKSSRSVTFLAAAVGVAALAGGLTACDADSGASTAAANTGTLTIGAFSNGAARETKIKVAENKSIRAELPKPVIKGGTLAIGLGSMPSGFPPLAYVGGDQKTLTGAEPDLGRMVAAVLGLKPETKNFTWENLFVGIDSGKVDVAFSNVTDTEERKQKYDFASYRKDNVAFEVPKNSTWTFSGDYHDLAGKTITVSSGTNQEKILLEWKKKLAKEGKKLSVKYFQDRNSQYLALASGRVDAYFGPNPGISYHITQVAKTPQATRNAGTFSGAGAGLQGLIGAAAKKNSGLAKPIADAINHLIDGGQYEKWLKAWNLSSDAVTKAEVNPPGLPLDNS